MKSSVNSYDFNLAKREYRQFCEQGEHNIQLFALPWYLDAVCDNIDDWKVIVYKENNKILAAFPFLYSKSTSGFWEIKNPWQAKRLGIWMDYGNNKTNYKREIFENKVVKYVLDNLPYFDVFQIDFDARFKNWRVFYENGFSQQTFYSYVVRKEQLDDSYISTIKKQNKRDISTLESIVTVEIMDSLEDYWNFFKKTFNLRGRTISYSKSQLIRLLDAAQKNESCQIFVCRDTSGEIVGSTVILFDLLKSYCMFVAFDPNLRLSPTVLLSYKTIIDSGKQGRDYDFEGSMISGIAKYYAGFNAEMEPYFHITKYSDKMMLRLGLKQFFSYAKTLLVNLAKCK